MRRLVCVIVAMLFVGCGGGGGGDHPPTISDLQISPTSAVVGEGGGVFPVNGNLSFTDSGGDLATLQMTTYDHTGNQVGSLSIPLAGLSGVTSGTLFGSMTFGTANADVFTYSVKVMDAAGNASNILQGTFVVTSQIVSFSQADITGTWDVVRILGGGKAGWFHTTRAFDATGNVTAVTNDLDSTGHTNSGPSTLRWGIDFTGMLHEFDNNVYTGFRGKMSSDKELISSAGTYDNSSFTMQMSIARKRNGTVFSNADLAGITFAYHALTTGSGNRWEYGAGYTDPSGRLAITSTKIPSGYFGNLLAPDLDTLSVSPEGIVTLASDHAFHGLMTNDKKAIFAVMGDQTVGYGLMVIMLTGQTFTQADYSGMFSFAALRGNTATYTSWAYGVGYIDVAGNGGYLSYAKSMAEDPNPSTYLRLLSTTGMITDPADATFHGQVSYNKDISVQTNTSAMGRYGLEFNFR